MSGSLSSHDTALRHEHPARDVATQADDIRLDTRARAEHSSLSYLDLRATSLARMDAGVGEPGDAGVAAAMADFRSAWQDLSNDPGGHAARRQVLLTAGSLASALAAQRATVGVEMATQRLTLRATVDETDAVARQLAATNRALSTAALDGVDVSDLASQRDQLGLRLAQLTGGVGLLHLDGSLDVDVAGVVLVAGADAGTLTVTSGVTATGGADGRPLTLGITRGASTTALRAGVGGRLGASADLLAATLPAYAAGLDTVARNLADTVNSAHAAGYDLDGNQGSAFFTCSGAIGSAASLAVDVTIREVAASRLPDGALDGSTADAIGTPGTAEDAYRRLVHGLGTEVAAAHRLVTTQALLTSQVDAAREQLAGLDLDDETVAMVTAQRAYEAAARVMSAVDTVLDPLLQRADGRPSAMRLRVQVAQSEQHVRNARNGLGWLDATASTLSGMAEGLRRAGELALQGASASTTGTTGAALATEVAGITECLLAQANATYLDRPVFGGATAGGRAFDSAGRYVGTDAPVQRRVGDGERVRIDVCGTDVVGSDGDTLFTDLTSLETALRLGDHPGTLAGIAAVHARQEAVGRARAAVGTTYDRVAAAERRARETLVTLRTALAEIEQADAPRAVDLQLQEMAYQAALASSAHVTQPSLVDFLG